MGDVVVRLGSEAAAHLREILAGDVKPAGSSSDLPCPLCQEIEAALDSPPVEEQVEFSAVVGPDDLRVCETSERAAAEEVLEFECRFGPYDDGRIQKRTVLTSPWTDLPSEEGER